MATWSRAWTYVCVSALMIGVFHGPSAEGANPDHPYGVIPYGFAYPTDRDIWKSLDIVYRHDMRKAKNWAPHGPGYYSCFNCGKGGCGPYGATPCCGLTPLHYNDISPANIDRPYPADPGISFYSSTPIPYSPVPGWNMPEYPAGVRPNGYSSMNGFRRNAKVERKTVGSPTFGNPMWYAGRETEQNFWAQRPAFTAQRP